jgi:tetratricopeptide (TPR) repeat protein
MPGRIEKTVFISYRRANKPWALFIYQYLTNRGYDVFIDFQNINSGNFETAILDNIRARAHFVVVLTPSALENCKNQGDWLRREIETAFDEKRNIVPLMVEGFDFGSQLVKKALTGKLAQLSQLNGLRIADDYPFEAMDRLRERYLNIVLQDVYLPTLTDKAKEATLIEKSAANKAAPVREEQLTAQRWFERGFLAAIEAKDFDEAIRFFSQAIRLNPDFAQAYHNRGTAYSDKGDPLKAIKDYTKAIRLKPDLAAAYSHRGGVYVDIGELKKAIRDCNYAIHLDPTLASAYNNRGAAYHGKGDIKSAINDYTKAINLEPDYMDAYRNRGISRDENGDLRGAIEDFAKAIRLKPDYATAYYDRGVAYQRSGNFEKAIKDYTKAINHNSSLTSAYHNRGVILEYEGDFISAIADFKSYLGLGGGIEENNQKEIEAKIKKMKSKLTKNKPTMKKAK